MCGIAAAYNGTDVDACERMLARLDHRGPDDSGSVALPHAWLGHTRLSIVDLAGGRQPLRSSEGSVHLVGNGEVYNHAAVRADTDADFVTESDNEVALHLIEHDPATLARLNGMFAFVVATDDGRFVAARDPVGIKPLYWSHRGDEVRFASEMAAFDADWQSEVEPFPPGCWWTPEDGLQRFASAVPKERAIPWHGDLVAGTRAVLVRAVEHQMMGDVPVGVFLSGGLDSSLVAAIAARRDPDLMTFAIGTPDSPDLAAARRVAEHLGTDHHEFTYTAAEALAALPDVVRSIESFDPGLVRSAVPNYLLARATAKHVKVVLTGEGADELFAGYAYMGEIESPDDLHAELERTVNSLHNLNLQRCDRVTMAHGLEARVPFLDLEVIRWGLSLPAAEKQIGPEKRLLREAFDGWLPHDLLWRVKAEFGDGSGARDVLSEAITADVTEADFASERDAVAPPLRTHEELAYYRVWRAHLAGISAERTLSRFARA